MSTGFTACHSSLTSPSCTLTRHPTFSSTRQYRHTTVRLLQRANRAARKQNVQIRAGLLSMFMPNKQINKAADLVNDLLETASRTDGGASTSQDQRTTIRDLAEQLRGAGGVQNPVFSDLVWGEYEVTYASKPQAAGGPVLRSAPGKLIFGSQKLRQTLIPTESLVNSVSFRALGIFPGNAIQDAVIEMLSGTKYKLTLQPAKIFGIQLGPSKSIERVFDVLYLDEKVRVVEFLPDQSPNSNSSEPVLFVLRRLSDVQHPQSGRQASIRSCFTGQRTSSLYNYGHEYYGHEYDICRKEARVDRKQASNQWQNAWEALQQTLRMKDLSSKQNGAGLATQAERKFKQQNR